MPANNKLKFRNNCETVESNQNKTQDEGFTCKDCGKSFRRSVFH